MKKSGLDIRRHDFQIMCSRVSQDDTDTRHLGDGSIHFTKILRTLTETLCNDTSFLLPLDNRSIRMIFVRIYPSNTNGTTTGRKLSWFESTPSTETSHLTIHSLAPNRGIRARAGLMIGIRSFGEVMKTRCTQVMGRIGMGKKTKVEQGRRCFRKQRPGRQRIRKGIIGIERNKIKNGGKGKRNMIVTTPLRG